MTNQEIEFISRISHIFYSLKSKLMKGFRQLHPDFGVNRTQGQVLILLKYYDQMTMSDLHYHTGLEKGSLTTLVDNLIKMGLVKRERGEQDRRLVIVRLTDIGLLKANTIEQAIALHYQHKLEKLSERERKMFYDALNTLIYIAEKL